MSRSSAVAMLLIESAKASFLLTREHRLLEREWDSVCGDPSIQSMVIHNTLPSSGLFKRNQRPAILKRSDWNLDHGSKHSSVLMRSKHASMAMRLSFFCTASSVELYLRGLKRLPGSV